MSNHTVVEEVAEWCRLYMYGHISEQELFRRLEKRLVGGTGIEPVTPSMSTTCSTAELTAPESASDVADDIDREMRFRPKLRRCECLLPDEACESWIRFGECVSW